jgi:tetratricopeptide (TPR) repeat protein
MLARQENWKSTAASYSNLSELQLTLGRITEASDSAQQAVSHAEFSRDAFQRLMSRTTLADALHQGGERAEAQTLFEEAEDLQQKREPEYPLLYSIGCFRYCDWLLAPVERAMWRNRRKGDNATALLNQLQAIAQRAKQTGEWAISWNLDQLSPALDHLTLARCALYADLLQNQAPGQNAQTHSQAALSGLRASGDQDMVPLGLLTRALLYHALGRPDDARADLAEAEDIARRGGMKLFLADIALHRARLFADRDALTEARRLIEECGYGRRLGELEDAEAAAKNWPQTQTTD